MISQLLLLVLLVCSCCCLAAPAPAAAAALPPVKQQHADLAGLLALKASICGSNCSELSSWTPNATDVCGGSFDGVFCSWAAGAWRVVGVQLQLNADAAAFNDSAMYAAGAAGSAAGAVGAAGREESAAAAAVSSSSGVLGLPHLRELELFCVTERPRPSPDPGPPDPVPPNTPLQQQQQLSSEVLAQFRQGLLQQQQPHTAAAAVEAAGLQGLSISRLLAAGDSGGDDGSSAQLGESAPPPAAAAAPPPPAAALGDLPHSWFAAYPRLMHLRVVGCGATGRLHGGSVAAARHLVSLVLSHNRLQGTLPDELVRLQDLSVLDLGNNTLTGPLPVSWVGLQHLHYLYLQNNNLTGTLPCEYTQLQLLLADLSGNTWLPTPFNGAAEGAAAGVGPCSSSAPAAEQQRLGAWESSASKSQQRRPLLSPRVTNTSSSSSSWPQQTLGNAAVARGALTAPRCWLRRYCYDEGSFICLKRNKAGQGAVGGCSSYVYGASDLHIDPLNQCDHGGTHLLAISVMFSAFAATLLLMWLHHCRLMRWMQQPGLINSSSSGGSGANSSRRHPNLQQQQQGDGAGGPWQQRQWLISGPRPPSRARARSRGHGGSGGPATAATSDGALMEPLLPHQQQQQQQQQQKGPVRTPVLPLLYHPATSQHEGAGYSSPVSSSSAADVFDAATVETVGTPSDGLLLPSALTTPSSRGKVSIKPTRQQQQQQQQPLGVYNSSRSSRRGAERRRQGLSAAASSSSGTRVQQQQQQEQEASGYESDSSSGSGSSMGGHGLGSDRNSNTVRLSGAWLNSQHTYLFHGNEPLPPWAGGVARMLAATLTAGPSAGAAGAARDGCFSGALLLPLVFLLLDTAANLRLLLLWGVGPPAHLKLWPSYALLGLLCVPHVLVGAVVHFRLLAIACLPPALKAAAVSEQQLAASHILLPFSAQVIHCWSWLFAAPAWLAYPLILLLLAPGCALLTLLCPLVLVTSACGLGSVDGVVRYVQLLQGCAALTQSSGSAGLLTVLFLMGNVPLEWSFLDSSLYYCTVFADLANVAAAWWLWLAGVRRQQALALAALPAATGQQWT